MEVELHLANSADERAMQINIPTLNTTSNRAFHTRSTNISASKQNKNISFQSVKQYQVLLLLCTVSIHIYMYVRTLDAAENNAEQSFRI